MMPSNASQTSSKVASNLIKTMSNSKFDGLIKAALPGTVLFLLYTFTITIFSYILNFITS